MPSSFRHRPQQLAILMMALLAHLLLPVLTSAALAGSNDGLSGLICSVGSGKSTIWQQLPPELRRDLQQQDELRHLQDHQCCIAHCPVLATGPAHDLAVANGDVADVLPSLQHQPAFSPSAWIIPFSRAPPH